MIYFHSYIDPDFSLYHDKVIELSNLQEKFKIYPVTAIYMLVSDFIPKQEIFIVITLLLLFVGSFTEYALAQTSSNANSTQRKSIPNASLPPINNLEEFTAKNNRIGFSLGPGSPSD